MIAPSAGIPPMPAFFITAAGQPMNESMVSKRIDAIGKRLNPEMPGNLRGSRLRKGIITMQRADKSSSITNQRLAKQMSHTVSTAQKYYNIEDEAQSDVDVALYLSSLFRPEPKPAEVPSSSNIPAATLQHLLPPINPSPPQPKVPALAVVTNVTNVPLPSPAEVVPTPPEVLPTPPEVLPNVPLATPAEVVPTPPEVLPIKPKDGPPAQPPNPRREKTPAAPAPGSGNVKGALQNLGKMSFAEKCLSWMATRKIKNQAKKPPSSASSSSDTRHYWTELQGEAVKNATMHLPFYSGVDTIYSTVIADETCQRHGIAELFTRQQIRDKFKNIAKKDKHTRF